MSVSAKQTSSGRRCLATTGLRAGLTGATLLLLALLLPRSAAAHGELLIRIADATRQIQAADTNDLARLHLARGELYRQDQNWEAAEADYTRAAQLDPGLDGVEFCRAKLLDDLGRLEASLKLFDQVIACAPTNGLAFIGRARVLVKLGRRPAAVADFERGLELLSQPQPEFFLEAAQAQAAEGRTNAALRSLDAGIKVFGPINPLQTFALELEVAEERHEAALARLETLLERALRKESWLARRGEILRAAGRPAAAREAFEGSLAAIQTLPPRLQQSPSMTSLRTRLVEALRELTNAPPAGPVAAP